MVSLPKYEPRASTRVYLGNYPLNKWSVVLILKIIIGNIYPQYRVVFDNTLSTVEHIRKGTDPGNWKTW